MTGSPVVVSGCIGPRFDGYAPQRRLTAGRVARYHAEQVAALADAGADLVSALTMTSSDEAIGITLAAEGLGSPGRDLVHRRDRRPATGRDAARPRHPDGRRGHGCPPGVLHGQLRPPRPLRCTCSPRVAPGSTASAGSGATPHGSATPSWTRPTSWTPVTRRSWPAQYVALRAANPRLTIMGGCCGTNHEHVAAWLAAVSGHGRRRSPERGDERVLDRLFTRWYPVLMGVSERAGQAEVRRAQLSRRRVARSRSAPATACPCPTMATQSPTSCWSSRTPTSASHCNGPRSIVHAPWPVTVVDADAHGSPSTTRPSTPSPRPSPFAAQRPEPRDRRAASGAATRRAVPVPRTRPRTRPAGRFQDLMAPLQVPSRAAATPTVTSSRSCAARRSRSTSWSADGCRGRSRPSHPSCTASRHAPQSTRPYGE